MTTKINLVHTTFNLNHLLDVIIMVNGAVVHHHHTFLHWERIELRSLTHVSQYTTKTLGQTHQVVTEESNKLFTVEWGDQAEMQRKQASK